jgi:hypothetical protein
MAARAARPAKLAGVNGIQSLSVRAPTWMNLTGHRFSLTSVASPARAEPRVHERGNGRGRQRQTRACAQRDPPFIHPPQDDDVGSERAGGHGRELGAGERDEADHRTGREQAPVRERQQREQHAQQSERGGVGVRQHEVEGAAGEADREQHGGGQAGRQRRQPVARERVEGGDDRGALREAEGVRGCEAAPEQPERERERIQPERPVPVAHVAVGERAVLDQVRRRQFRAGVDLGHAPALPRQRGEHGEARAEREDRGGVVSGGTQPTARVRSSGREQEGRRACATRMRGRRRRRSEQAPAGAQAHAGARRGTTTPSSTRSWRRATRRRPTR